MPPKLSLPHRRGHFFLFQNYPCGEGNCEAIERQKLSRGDFCPGTEFSGVPEFDPFLQRFHRKSPIWGSKVQVFEGQLSGRVPPPSGARYVLTPPYPGLRGNLSNFDAKSTIQLGEKTPKGQVVPFSRVYPEQKFNVNRACFPKENHQNSQKLGEIHELFVLALSLVWFAGATPD